jgi:hypothetical protein
MEMIDGKRSGGKRSNRQAVAGLAGRAISAARSGDIRYDLRVESGE